MITRQLLTQRVERIGTDPVTNRAICKTTFTLRHNFPLQVNPDAVIFEKGDDSTTMIKVLMALPVYPPREERIRRYLWRYGRPPSVGWWPVMIRNSVGYQGISWWSGSYWSMVLSDLHTRKTIEALQEGSGLPRLTDEEQRRVLWSFRPDTWPVESFT